MRRVASRLVVAVLSVVCISSASAQQAPAKKSFDVASVKAAGPLDPQKLLSGQQRVGMKMDAGRVDIENLSMLELLNLAFKVSPSRMTGPGFGGVGNALTATRFDIHATIPSGATKDDVPEMLQSLLVERWKLAYHFEKKQQDVLGLLVGKDGPKLVASLPDPAPAADAPAANNTNRPDALQVSGDPQKGMTIRGAGQAGAMRMNMSPDGTMRLEAEKLTMEQLADSIVQFVGKPVVDLTGLAGNYKVVIELTREDLMAVARAAGLNIPGGAAGAGPAGGAADPSGGVSIYRSVENMGLKLENRKAAIDYLVIDKLEKMPTED